MKTEVAAGIQDLRRQFPDAAVTEKDDDQGGAFVVLDPVDLGAGYAPSKTWMGFHIPAQYPYADIYPIFIGAEVRRRDGVPFEAPITTGHHFQGRPALQVSRRSTAAATNGNQKVPSKILKILDYLAKMSK